MWLNMAQARKRLGVSQGDLARLVQDGKGEMVSYYGHRRYSEESIDRCVEEMHSLIQLQHRRTVYHLEFLNRMREELRHLDARNL